MARLPINPWYFVWGADGKRLLITVETPRDADAWWGVGVLNPHGLAVVRRDLLEPTEDLFVCPSTGHVFTGFADFRNGLRPEHAVEYDSDVTHARRLRNFPPGHFSANCKYVATTDFFHGPVPWGIFEVSTGRKLIEEEAAGWVPLVEPASRRDLTAERLQRKDARSRSLRRASAESAYVLCGLRRGGDMGRRRRIAHHLARKLAGFRADAE